MRQKREVREPELASGSHPLREMHGHAPHLVSVEHVEEEVGDDIRRSSCGGRRWFFAFGQEPADPHATFVGLAHLAGLMEQAGPAGLDLDDPLARGRR